jgi:hypothetical protein
MNQIIGTLLCTALLCAGTASAQSRTEHSSTKQTLHFAGTGPHILELRDINGAISVEAYSGRDVEMIVEKSVRADSEDDLRAAERDVTLDTSDNADLVRVVVREPNQGVCGEESHNWSWFRTEESRYHVRFDFTIRVPPDTQLRLCTVNEGDIRVRGTRGEFSVHSVNGRITMTDIAGAGEAITVNGPVEASFVSAPHAASVFKTINGSVVLTLPEPPAVELRMKTLNGGLYTDFDVQTLPAEALRTVQKRDGMSVYRSNGFTSFRVGSGGPELTLDTLNGDVRVLRRPK